MEPHDAVDAAPAIGAGARDRVRTRVWMRRARGYLRAHPVALSGAVLVLVLSVAVGGAWGSAPIGLAASAPAFGQGWWWTPVTALLVASTPVDLVLSVLLMATVLAYAERMLGHVRTVVVFLVTGAASILLGILLRVTLGAIVDLSAFEATDAALLDPTVGTAGAVMAASAFAPTLWRRRIRYTGFAILAMFALYAGDVDSWYRLGAALLGMPLGALLARGRDRRPWHHSSTRETRSLVALIVAVTALGPVAALIAGGGRGPLSRAVTTFTQYDEYLVAWCEQHYAKACDQQFALLVTRGLGPELLALVPLVLLLVAAWGLRTGRRAAWLLALAVNIALIGLAAVTLVVFGGSVELGADAMTLEYVLWVLSSLGLPAGILVTLLITWRRFRVRATRRATVRFLVATAIAFVAGFVVLLVIGAIFRRSFDVPPQLADLVVESARRFVPPAFLQGLTQSPYPRTGAALLTYQWIGVGFWIVVMIGMLRLYRHPSRPSPGERTLFRSLLRRSGGGTLGFLGTWPDNVHWFSEDGQAAVSYRVIGGVALALADPVCEPARADRTIREFADFAIQHGWVPAFYSIHEDFVPALDAMGWRRMSVGEETVMRLADLAMTGKRWQKVRHPLTKLEREGMVDEWTRWGDLPPRRASQIREISEQWVADRALPEMGFTLGGLDEIVDPDVALLLAVDAEGRVQAVTSWMPVWRDGVVVGRTLDFMRRRGDAPNGVMEFLIARAALRMKEEGLDLMSLSGAPLATKPIATDAPAADASAVTGFLGWLASVLEPAYGFASLFRFKSKFQPEYRTMYLAYADPVLLPTIGAAVARAYLPEASPGDMLALLRSVRGAR